VLALSRPLPRDILSLIDKAAKIARAAHANRTTLKEEAIRLGCVSTDEFDRLVRPEHMTRPG
jgi:fumarate hydratase, class II